MKTLVFLLALCGLSVAQFFNRQQQFRPQQQFRQPQFQQQQFRQPQFQQPQQQVRQGGGGGAVDDTFGGSQYHFSWRHARAKWGWGQAQSYCRGLGGGWLPVSIESGQESSYVNRVIGGERQEYIWTGGQSSGRGWAWASGAPFSGLNWSRTGGAGRPQPDNREGNEVCLAVLNNFYQDGITWHDVSCHHTKPIICERPASG